MQLFFAENIDGNTIYLDTEESNHLVKVLRKRLGDRVACTDGRGNLFQCIIRSADPKKTLLSVESRQFEPEDDFHIHLAICPTKNAERMEWLVEKITEIGVHEITLMQSEHSERNTLKIERLQKKILSGCKQSLKTRFPKLHGMVGMEKLISDHRFDGYQRFIAYVDKDNDRHLFEKASRENAYLVLIGPEGDFSQKELELAFEYSFLPCSLGKSRLRTETAGIVAVHTLQLLNSLIV